MLSTSLEKYLICIYQHLEKNEEIKISELAKEMKQTLKFTIQSLQRLHFQRFIVYSTYQPIKITETGKEMACYFLARNALIDEFFNFLHLANDESEKGAIAQYLSYDSLTKIEKFMIFVKKYPEIGERFDLLLHYPLDEHLLPTLPKNER